MKFAQKACWVDLAARKSHGFEYHFLKAERRVLIRLLSLAHLRAAVFFVRSRRVCVVFGCHKVTVITLTRVKSVLPWDLKSVVLGKAYNKNVRASIVTLSRETPLNSAEGTHPGWECYDVGCPRDRILHSLKWLFLKDLASVSGLERATLLEDVARGKPDHNASRGG